MGFLLINELWAVPDAREKMRKARDFTVWSETPLTCDVVLREEFKVPCPSVCSNFAMIYRYKGINHTAVIPCSDISCILRERAPISSIVCYNTDDGVMLAPQKKGSFNVRHLTILRWIFVACYSSIVVVYVYGLIFLVPQNKYWVITKFEKRERGYEMKFKYRPSNCREQSNTSIVVAPSAPNESAIGEVSVREISKDEPGEPSLHEYGETDGGDVI